MHHLPIIYAQTCPEEPIVPRHHSSNHATHHHINPVYEDEIQDQLSQATRVITRKNYHNHNNEYQPRIIRAKRIPYHHSFQLMERDRELKSMRNRIENVKSLQQRKKDRNDPIMYPPYFVRSGPGPNSDVRIDAYTKKALNSTNWKLKQREMNKIYDNERAGEADSRARKQVRKYQYNLTPKEQQNRQVQMQQNPQHQSQLPSPAFHHHHPPSLRPTESTPTHPTKPPIWRAPLVTNLPQNDIRCILDYIYNNLMYKDKDLQALKSRMLHAYGKDQVQNTWGLAMRLLERDI